MDRGRERPGGVPEVPTSPTYARTRPTAGPSPIARLRGHGPGHGPHPRTRARGRRGPARAASLDAAWAALAEHHRLGFLAAGAAEAVVRREPADGTPFGARLRRLVAELRPAGLVVLGAGSIPLATAARPGGVRACRRGGRAGRAREPPLLGGRRGDRRGGRGPRQRARSRLRQRAAALARGGRRHPRPRPRDEAAAGDGRRLAARPRAPRGHPRRAEAARSGSTRRRPSSATAWRRCARSRRTRAPSCSSPAGPRPPTCAGSSATRGRGPGPWSRSGACGRPRPAPSSGARTDGRPGACWARCWIGTVPASLGRHVAAIPTAR